MTYLSKKFFQVVALVLGTLLLFLLGEIDSLAYRGAEVLFPGSGVVVVLCLLAVEIFALLYLYRAFFSRPSRLILKTGASEEERLAFVRELKVRLEHNPHILHSGISRDDPEFLSKAIAHLDTIADAEIRSNGKKVFLGTALSQNGRLDALIVFISLCRMVWRVSAIYNQRPTAEEIWSVLSTVSSSTFVAFSIEALDIPQMITDTMNEMVPSIAPAVAASSTPFIGSCLNVFTESVIDGAANCLLAIRAGIITRRAYSYALYGGSDSLRRLCVRETASMMLDITQESVAYVAKALRKELQEVSIGTGKKLVEKTADGVRTTVRAAGQATEKAASAVKGGASYVTEGTVLIAGGVGQVAGQAKDRAVSAVKDSASFLADGAGLIRDGVGSAAGQLKDALVEGARQVAGVAQSALPKGKKPDGELPPETPANETSHDEKTSERAEPASRPIENILNASVDARAVPSETAESRPNAESCSSPAEKGVLSQAKGAANAFGREAGRAVSYVAEGTSLLVGGVGNVAHAVGNGVQEKGKKIAGFIREKSDGIRGLFK